MLILRLCARIINVTVSSWSNLNVLLILHLYLALTCCLCFRKLGVCVFFCFEAIQHLPKLWGHTDVNIKEKIANCTNTGKDNTKIFVKLEQGFSITCENGSIVTLAIKEKSKNIQKISILDLKFSMCGLPGLKEFLLDGSNISGHLKDLEQWNRNGLTRLSLRH